MSTAPTTALTSSQIQMEQLCESFPSLRGKYGSSPWNQFKFAEGLRGCSHGEKHARLFVLSVWNNSNENPWWRQHAKLRGHCMFDAVAALRIWDAAHAKAFLDWCDQPLYP